MISIKANVAQLIHRAIISAFPVTDLPVIKPTISRDEIYQFDYFCEAPKEIFEKYKMKSSFYGHYNYKDVAEDIKVQVPRNPLISKIETTQNGALKIKIDDEFIKYNTPTYDTFIRPTKKRHAIICLPGLVYRDRIDFEYFRGMNIAEKLQRALRMVNYKTRFVLPIVDSAIKRGLDPGITRMEYNNLVQNSFFKIDPDVQLTSDLAEQFFDHFEDMKRDYILAQRKGKTSVCTLSLLLYYLQAKYDYQDNLIFISSLNQESFVKRTLKNFGEANETKRYYGSINQNLDPKFKKMIEEEASSLDLKLNIEEVVKALDSYHPSTSTQNVGSLLVEEFCEKILFLMLETYKQLKEHRKMHDVNVPYVEMDDLGRLVALKLLRFNEIIDETLQSGDLTKMFQYWEDIAKLWWNIFDTKSFEKISNKSYLLYNSIVLYNKFFYIFFGAECKQTMPNIPLKT